MPLAQPGCKSFCRAVYKTPFRELLDNTYLTHDVCTFQGEYKNLLCGKGIASPDVVSLSG